MNVQAVMNRNVQCAGTGATAADVAWIMERTDCGSVPIVDRENKLIGMVTDRDICLAMARRPVPASAVAITEIMSKEVYACSADEEVSAALQTMQNKRVRRLPVIDAEKRPIGILSMDDVVLHAEARKAPQKANVAYRDAIETLQGIYRRPGSKKELIARA